MTNEQYGRFLAANPDEAIPGVAPLLPRVATLFERMGRLRLSESALERSLKGLYEREGSVDFEHDRLMRGLIGTIDTLIEFSVDPAFVAQLKVIREKAFPLGAQGIIQSYLDESGYATMAEMKMTDADRAVLAGISYDGRTLLDDYNAWVAAKTSVS